LLTIAGILVGWAGEARIARWLDPIFGRWMKPKHNPNASTYLPPNRRYLVSHRNGPPGRPVPFFALDRSVPSLALDSAFGSHDGLGPYLSIWFYLQRILSFLILLLMVAGAFNVFQ